MALNNWKKNLNRVGQKFNEKVAGYKGTQKGENYKVMTDQIDLYKKHLDELSSKTVEVLQPNPTIRAKMGAMGTLAKLKGTSSQNVYRQAEAELAEVMNKYGNSLGSQSIYGRALLDAGSAFVDIADLKFSNEDNIREHFLGPVHTILTQDIKEINALRKKCESRRLDYDTERKSHEKSKSIFEYFFHLFFATSDQKPDDHALNEAQSRFEEAMENTSLAMANFLNSEPEHISNLSHMVKSMMEYHEEAAKVLAQLYSNLEKRQVSSHDQSNRYSALTTSPLSSRRSYPNIGEMCCRALFPFKAENDNELEFNQGEIIKLIEQVDQNWYLGELRGRAGHFPINYVEVLPSN